MDRPFLTVVAGCNGSGKSSFSNAIVPKGVIPFDYDKNFLKTYDRLIDTEFRDVMAHSIVTAELESEIQDSLLKRKNFCYETNFNSTPLFWPEMFKESGFALNLVFFCLDSVEEAKRRVQIRVENGGHFVPESEIVSRYYEGYRNLNKHFQYFDNVHLLNSSYYYQEPKHILSIGKGQVLAVGHVPEFLDELIPRIICLT
ncbi:putative ABC-type ATPase [Algoriphagus ratkowskyi]|uniref:Putative ABC-type ATPase n=1 Tax=Algoriphagus ratkowskyi TaxID=57028 RepID=A0A2W7R0Z6_9BACT|nr:zeta toxin family protein [Algoriphagus ratkowskyi]PZX51880.1 putative ABC-type ATPase [Algoriphagus ratkowskyi]